jgi:hypothetical protein
MTCGDADHARLALWLNQTFGLIPSKLAVPHCPRVVAGKRCFVGMRSTCICEQYYPRLFDHGALWRLPRAIRGRAEYVLTGEPYDFNWDDVDDFNRERDSTDLDVRLIVTTRSFWYPPSTALILCLRADTWLLPMAGDVVKER